MAKKTAPSTAARKAARKPGPKVKSSRRDENKPQRDLRWVEPHFPADLTKSLMHDSGLFGVVMLPTANLPAFAGHPNDNICSASVEAAHARNDLIESIRDGLCTCLSCREMIAAPRHMAAIVFVRGLGVGWHSGGGYGAVCDKCGVTDIALEKSMHRLAHSWKTAFARRFAEVTGQTPPVSSEPFVFNAGDIG